METFVVSCDFGRMGVQAREITTIPAPLVDPLCDTVHNIGNWVNADMVTNDILCFQVHVDGCLAG